MRRLRAWLQTAILVLTAVAGCAAANSGDGWSIRDFKSFTLRAPSDWVSVTGGTDSLAGRLAGSGVQLDYDFGLYSDPLNAPYGARDLQAESHAIDGLSARRVSFSQPSDAGASVHHCVGIHVPQVRQSSMGNIRFTALACTKDPARLALARSVLSTLRFPGTALR